MKYIKSTSNQLVKEIFALHSKKGRDNTGAFLLEGSNSVKESLKDNLKVKLIAYREGYSPSGVELAPETDSYIFSNAVFKKICTTDSPANIIAVAMKKDFSWNDIIQKNKKNYQIVVLDQIKDPGNLGTIIRTCCAAETDGILLTDECVDIYNPKVVRSTAGCLWKIPVVYIKEVSELINKLKSVKCKIYATDASAELSYLSANYNNNIALIFGSEAHGISEKLLQQCDERIAIPISPKVESLNISSSVAALLFEVKRQQNLLQNT